MDLSKVPNEKKLYLCRWYFRGKRNMPFCITRTNPKTRFSRFRLSAFFVGGQCHLVFQRSVSETLLRGTKGHKEMWVAALLQLCSKIDCAFVMADVIFSGLGAIVWAIVIVCWVVMFQLNRSNWGEFADDISFIIPLGVP